MCLVDPDADEEPAPGGAAVLDAEGLNGHVG